MLTELIEEIYSNNPEIESLACSHNIASNPQALNELSQEITEKIQAQIREQFGDILELVHGSETELPSTLDWQENSSFTDEFDLEFAGEAGYIVIAQVPVERIKFYLPDENEFVITAGQLNCEVESVVEYFGL